MRLLRRLAYWLRWARHHTDLMDELALHREMVEQDLIRRGMSTSAARDAARRTMGNETLMRETSRGIWLWLPLEGLWQDATYTLRDLRRTPTFTIGVVLTLGLSIGANAAMVLWPGRDPIGQCFRVGIDPDAMPCTYVVGVAEDIHSQSLEAEPRLYFYYLAAAQWRPDDGGLFVRARGDPLRLVEPLRSRLQREMPGTSFITVSRSAPAAGGSCSWSWARACASPSSGSRPA